MTRNLCTKQQLRQNKKSSLRNPCTALNQGMCKFVGGAIQCLPHTVDFWTHFHFDYSLTQRVATLQIRLATVIVNAQPRNSHLHACELCIKYFASFRPKNLQFLFLHLQFRMTKFVITESWTAWQWVNNAIDPATALSSIWIDKPKKTYLHDATHGNNRVDIIYLATTKHIARLRSAMPPSL